MQNMPALVTSNFSLTAVFYPQRLLYTSPFYFVDGGEIWFADSRCIECAERQSQILNQFQLLTGNFLA